MLSATLDALRTFPDTLARHVHDLPAAALDFRPPSWDGIPSERFTIREQLCHVRDIEIDGYHLRFHRLLNEESPSLVSIDSEALVGPRGYADADPAAVVDAIRAARATTVAILERLGPAELARAGRFEGYGAVTVRGLAHYLCSHDQQHLAGVQWLLGQRASI